MLRTISLTSFLNQCLAQSPHLHTLLLLTPNGLLLSSSSPLPTSILRKQATLTSQIWALYEPLATGSTISSALPPSSKPDLRAVHSEDSNTEQENKGREDLKCITIQLEEGITSIRQLSCDLLFVAIGPPSENPSALLSPLSALSLSASSDPTNMNTGMRVIASGPQSMHAASANVSRVGSLTNTEGGNGFAARAAVEGERERLGSRAGSEVSVGSSVGMGVGMTVVRQVRGQSEIVAEWLDKELKGFVLGTM
jgi:hypothetical protein